MRHLKKILFIAANALLVALFIVCAVRYSSLADSLESQKTAARWAGGSGERYSQITCLFPRGGEITEDSLYNLSTTIDSKLTQNSLEAAPGGRLWTYAYAAMGEVTVERGAVKASSQAIGVGGDFFIFHPLKLRSGSLLSGNDLNRDLVVLDVNLAWKLFGSNDIAGMEMLVGDTVCVVAGVVELESDDASELAFTGDSCIFVSYELLAAQTGAGISCLELVLPDPVTGFAMGIAEESAGGKITLENTGRFKVSEIVKLITDFGARSIQDSGIVYPYWENAARVVEDKLAFVMALAAIFAAVPVVTLIWLVVKLIRCAISRKRDILAFFGRAFSKLGARIKGAGKGKRRSESTRRKNGSKSGKRGERRGPPSAERTARPKPRPELPTDEDIRLDLESIVREVMDEQ